MVFSPQIYKNETYLATSFHTD